mgnify:CR=1 FL=1
MITRVGMAPRLPGMSVEGFQTHWRTVHADAASRIPGVLSYVQNHALFRHGRLLLPYPGFDVCAELEFDDLAAMDAGFASPHYQETVRSDEPKFIDRSRFSLVLAERHVQLEGSPPDEAVKLLTFLRAHPAYPREWFVEALMGPYAKAVRVPGVQRHEQLIALPEAHTGRQPPACDGIDILWFADADEALEFVNSEVAQEAFLHLAGRSFGAERLIARPLRIV